MLSSSLVIAGLITLGIFLIVLIPIMFRTVVSTNDIHIVQSTKTTTPFGKDQPRGNTYYNWPSWIPLIGIKVIKLPVSIFDVSLEGYPGYDQGRVPFVVDIMAFFRITDPNIAAQRIHTFQELEDQLKSTLQGAVRSILATSEIESILEGRATFADRFTKEVDMNLQAWGVQTVKCIELMDIRDAQGSRVIQEIMAKKMSLINMQSRTEVAANNQRATTAEIEAKQTIDIRNQEALQLVGQRTADQERQVGIAKEQATQSIMAEAKTTAQRRMEVVQVEEVRKAEIQKEVQIVAAEQQKATDVIFAEGDKKKTVIVAEGHRDSMLLNAEGIKAEGDAKGAAEQAMLMAPVNSQITLAKEIGANEPYQKYLIQIRVVEKDEAVGKEQARALVDADIRVIANSGDVISGVNKGMDLFTSKGGTNLGGMIEGFAQTPLGAAIAARLGLSTDASAPSAGK